HPGQQRRHADDLHLQGPAVRPPAGSVLGPVGCELRDRAGHRRHLRQNRQADAGGEIVAFLDTEDRASRKTVIGRMLIGLVVVVVFLIPYGTMMIGSLKTQAEILQIPPSFMPQDGLQWSNYVSMWDTPETPVP